MGEEPQRKRPKQNFCTELSKSFQTSLLGQAAPRKPNKDFHMMQPDLAQTGQVDPSGYARASSASIIPVEKRETAHEHPSGPLDRNPVPRPTGAMLRAMMKEVLKKAPGSWRTLALLVHQTGMDFGSARRLRWSQVSRTHIRWASSRIPGGEFNIEQSSCLSKHLKTLSRESEFVCSSLALLNGVETKKAWLKQCWAQFPKYGRFLKRYSIWSELAKEYQRLADNGELPRRTYVQVSAISKPM